MRRSITPFILVMMLWSTGLGRAQTTSALINEALDKPVKLDLNGPLPRVIDQIETETAVPFENSRALYDALPWGEQTNVTAKVQNQTLRDALTAITRKLGLTFIVRDEAVELVPLPALRRLGRRATVQELQSLDQLASTPLQLDTDRPGVLRVVGAIDERLVALKSPFAIENRAFGPEQDTPLFVARGGSLLDALESITRDTTATWYPWGRSIVIVNKQDWIRTQLARTISARYNGVDLSQVLMELSQRSGVDFTLEPGAVQRVPPEFRSVRLILDNVSVQQVLETLSGFTGMGYVVNERGVYLWNPSYSALPPAPPVRADPVVGMIQLEDGIELLLRESQIPPDLRDYLRIRTDGKLRLLRSQMQQEVLVPTTQPVP